MNKQDLYYRMALSQVVGIGPKKHKILVGEVDETQQLFNASLRFLKNIPGISEANAHAIKDFSNFGLIEKELNFCEKNNIQILCFDDEIYPRKLSNCIDAPSLLFFKGNANLNYPRSLSIIGTRSFTEYGRKLCDDLIAELKAYDVVIYSGLAYGIDIISHKACLKQELSTVGVVAHGLGTIYPPAHASTAKEMIEKGGLLSEYFSGEKAEKGNFPTRNRIVAGISDATIVIETDMKGGSMITAEIAYSYNKDVFSFPGRIGDSKSAGCNFLIKSLKAQMATCAEDIANSLGWNNLKKSKPPQRQLFIELNPDEENIVAQLKEKELTHIDEIYTKTGLSSSQVASAMLSLEMQGIIKVQPGKLFSLL
jgi:DNA processing protein